ncbi:MAG: prepilin peptidase [Rhodoglobus sp.]
MIAVPLVGVLGLLVGSFLNVVVHRVPQGRSIVAPPSACPGCGGAIAPHDNIPVLSWLMLRGKCRACAEPISWRYPLVELGTAVLFAVVAFRFGTTALAEPTAPRVVAAILVIIALLYFAAVSIALALIDIDTHRLPNVIVLPSYLVAAVLLATASILQGDYPALIRAAVGMAALFVAYLVMAFAYPGGMGLGDVKLAGVIGMYLGWAGWGALAVGAFSAFLLAGVFSVILMVTKRANRKSGIPFGPWMLGGAWLGLLAGGSLFDSYLSIFDLAG